MYFVGGIKLVKLHYECFKPTACPVIRHQGRPRRCARLQMTFPGPIGIGPKKLNRMPEEFLPLATLRLEKVTRISFIVTARRDRNLRQ